MLTTLFPGMVSAFPAGYVFSFFACTPEKKGVLLEQIQKQLGIE
jgi:hypothetical protein